MTPKTIFIGSIIILALLLCAYGIYTYSDLKRTETETNQLHDSLNQKIGGLEQRILDLENKAVPIETRIIERETNYIKIPEMVKGLKATEKSKLLHEKLEEGTKY